MCWCRLVLVVSVLSRLLMLLCIGVCSVMLVCGCGLVLKLLLCLWWCWWELFFCVCCVEWCMLLMNLMCVDLVMVFCWVIWCLVRNGLWFVVIWWFLWCLLRCCCFFVWWFGWVKLLGCWVWWFSVLLFSVICVWCEVLVFWLRLFDVFVVYVLC